MHRQPRIGQRLAAARLRRRRSQADVARRAGIAPSYLSRIENGRVQPTYRTLCRVARALEIGFDELAGFDEESRHHGALCPVSEDGRCLLDLIRADTELARERHADSYTVRQVALLRRFAGWLRDQPPDRQRAVEVLLDDLTRSGGT